MPELKLENSLVDNRYEVFERLGRGSFAEIFVARDRETGGREVVIKALNTHLQGTPDADLERTLVENFQNEAVALDGVRHPNVILRWGHGTAADLRGVPFHYLVLEYMPGGDLLKLCRSRANDALPLNDALAYFKQACEALAYAHSKGIIHRDIKPNNLLLAADRRVLKIADFGVAKITTGEDTDITRVGADIYAPPEHHPGEEPSQHNRLTAAADIYSLAKSFYTVICGMPPKQFRADPITYLPGELMNEPWSSHLLAVLNRATDDNPQSRHASVAEFWSDLAQVASIGEQADAAADDEDDVTLVKPRLSVSPGALPATPVKPEFDPTLSSARPQVKISTATAVGREAEAIDELKVAESAEIREARAEPQPRGRGNSRSSKFFIDLQDEKPGPDLLPAVKAEPPAKQAGKSELKRKPGDEAEEHKSGKKKKKKVEDKFNQRVRLYIFIGLLILTFVGSMVSVYHYVRKQNAPIGFGPPTEVEVVAGGLYVRTGPMGQELGKIAKGTRHRVLEMGDNDWILIEVNEWSELSASPDPRQGWVYGNLHGNTPYVRVTSRRLW